MSEQYTSLSLFYDAFMQDIDYGEWCDFYEEAFRRFSTGPVENLLDIGCGTGNITLPMALRGYKTTGLDLSEEMLALAEQKAYAAHAGIRFLGSDMRSFTLGFRVLWMLLVYPKFPTFHTIMLCYLVSWILNMILYATFFTVVYRRYTKKGICKKI